MKTKNINISNVTHTRSQNRIAFKVLLGIFVFGIIAPVISNDQPLFVKYKGENYFPAFHVRNSNENKVDNLYLSNNLYSINWKTIKADRIIFTPFKYSNQTFDYLNADYVSPFEKQLFKDADGKIVEMPLQYRHWLGTGKKGEDVLAVLLYGARYTLFISFIATAMATLIGLTLGVIAGYYGNYHFKTTIVNIAGLVIGIFLGYFYGFKLRGFAISEAYETAQWLGMFQFLFSTLVLIGVSIFCFLIGDWFSELFSIRKNIFIPVDRIISKFIALFVSVPALILIISFTALMKPSMLTIILVIGLTGWPTIARMVRAEMMKIKNLNYIESARALGFNDPYIIINHALPNVSSALYVVVIYMVAAAIILESSLSFLGIGMPNGIISWGAILSQSKENFNAWWISLFPGGMIFITLYYLNSLAMNFRNRDSF